MKSFVAVLALAAVAQSAVVPAGLPLAYGGYHLGAYNLAGYNLAAPYTTLAAAPAAAVTYAAAPAIAAPAVAAPAIAPVTYAAAAPAIASSQFHQQDEFGNLAYGYADINSAKHEQGNTYGGVTGSYSYIDSNGIRQTTNYIADALGFRVQASNLPVAPVANLAQPVHTLVGPAPVEDTPEVKAARAEHLAKVAEASRQKRSLAYSFATPYGYPALNYGAYHPGLYAASYAAPLAAAPLAAAPLAAAPAAVVPATGALEGTLTKIQNNPGFAVSYRID